MKNPSYRTLSLMSAFSFLLAPVGHSVEIIPITSFDPTTFFEGGITAGIDFDDNSPTQSGFTGIPASNDKEYNVISNGVTFDLKVRNANFANQNRNRNNAVAGDLVNDFEQWYGGYATVGNEVEATVTMTGLLPNTDYQVSFFTFNLGAGQTSTRFYDGATSDDPLITEFRTAGNQNNFSTWSPGITLQFNSGSNAEIVVTLQAVEFVNTGSNNFDSRLGLCGISLVSQGAPPLDLGITSIEVDPATDEVTLSFTGLPNTTYSCLSSTDLEDFSTIETPINDTTLVTDETGNGTFVLDASEIDKKFFRMEVSP